MNLDRGDLFARLLCLDPRHGYQLPSTNHGELGRRDPTLPMISPFVGHFYVLAVTLPGLVGLGILTQATWVLLVALVVGFLALTLTVRSVIRLRVLDRAYPLPFVGDDDWRI